MLKYLLTEVEIPKCSDQAVEKYYYWFICNVIYHN